jgi:hypothetical protein
MQLQLSKKKEPTNAELMEEIKKLKVQSIAASNF